MPISGLPGFPINPASIAGQIPDSNAWPTPTLTFLVKIFLPVLLVPATVLYLVNKLRNWGWWRLRKQTSNEREVYVRVWHGWITREKYYRSIQKPEKLKQFITRKLAWKSTTADYSWVFWDPNGIEQQAFRDDRDRTIIRHLPAWMRSYRHGTAGWNDRLGDPERGQASKGHIHRSSNIESERITANLNDWRLKKNLSNQIDKNHRRTTSQLSLNMMSGALLDLPDEDDTSTLRRRRIPDGRPPIWCTGSKETDRAALCQLILPGIENPIPSSNLDTVGGEKSLFNVQIGITQSKTCAHNISQTKAQSTSLFQPRSSECPVAPVNSPNRLTMLSGDYQNSSQLESLQIPSDRFDVTSLSYDKKFAHSLERRLDEWEGLRSASPYISIGRPDCGIAGRNGTPVTSIAPILLPSDEHVDFNAYEAEDSIDGAISLCGSSAASTQDIQSNAVTRYTPWYRRSSATWSERWKSNPGPLGLNSSQASQGQLPYLSCSSPRAMSSPHVSHVSFIKPRKRRRLVDRGICVSPPCEPTEPPQNDWDKALLTGSLFDRTSPLTKSNANSCLENGNEKRFTGMNGVNRDVLEPQGNMILRESIEKNRKPLSSLYSSHPPSCCHKKGSVTLQEFQFTHDLDSRLNRLLYELSPGFRGPRGNRDRLYWGRSPVLLSHFSGDAPSRATQTTIRHLTYPFARLKRSFSSPDRPSSPHGSDFRSFRGRSTVTADRPRRSKGEPAVHGIPYPNANFSEPDEGAIDVLAWILRRPPQGFQHDDQAPSTLYTGTFGKIRTRAAWETLPSRRKFMICRLKSAGLLLTGRRSVRSDIDGEEAFDSDTLAENSEKTLVNEVGGEAHTG